MQKVAVVGVFSNRIDAEEAISDLEYNGFSPKDMSLLLRDSQGDTSKSQTASLAFYGILIGGVIGAIAALLVITNSVNFSALGTIFIVSPLISLLGIFGSSAIMLSGVLTGALYGGIIGFLLGAFVPSERFFSTSKMSEKGVLVTVPVPIPDEHRAREIFKKFNADTLRTISLTGGEMHLSTTDEEPVTEPSSKKSYTAYNPDLEFQPAATTYYSQVTPGRYRNEEDFPYNRSRKTQSYKPFYQKLPLKFKKFINDMDYPVSKQDLLSFSEHTPDYENLTSVLESIPNRIYDNEEQLAEVITDQLSEYHQI